jgi:hypothetical protein
MTNEKELIEAATRSGAPAEVVAQIRLHARHICNELALMANEAIPDPIIADGDDGGSGDDDGGTQS